MDGKAKYVNILKTSKRCITTNTAQCFVVYGYSFFNKCLKAVFVKLILHWKETFRFYLLKSGNNIWD